MLILKGNPDSFAFPLFIWFCSLNTVFNNNNNNNNNDNNNNNNNNSRQIIMMNVLDKGTLVVIMRILSLSKGSGPARRIRS